MGSLDRALLTGFICRICSEMSRMVIHAHGEEGKRINLAAHLRNFLGVDVDADDNLPKTVCPTCISKIKMYYDWMEVVMKNQREIQKRNIPKSRPAQMEDNKE